MPRLSLFRRRLGVDDKDQSAGYQAVDLGVRCASGLSGEVRQFAGGEAFADGDESVGAGEATAVSECEEAEGGVGASAASQVAEDEAPPDMGGPLLQQRDDVVVAEVVQEMIGEKVVHRIARRGHGVQALDIQAGDVAVFGSCPLRSARIRVDGGDLQSEAAPPRLAEQPGIDIATAGAQVQQMVIAVWIARHIL